MTRPQTPGRTTGDALAARRRDAMLEFYRVLGADGTTCDKELAEIADLARHVTGADGAEVNLIGGDRQLTLASSADRNAPRVRPLRESICARVLETFEDDDLVVLPDAATHPLLGDHPSVRGPGAVTFYAGAPLVTSQGRPLGMLCVFADRPRDLDGPQRRLLRHLARAAVRTLDDHRRAANPLRPLP